MLNISDIRSSLKHIMLPLLPTVLMSITILCKANMWVAYFSAVAWLIYMYQLYNIDIQFYALSFFLLFLQTSGIFSGVYIESGNFIFEQAVYGYATGATARLVFYNSVFFVSALWSYQWIKRLKPSIDVNSESLRISSQLRFFVLFSSATVITLLLFGLLKYGSPLLLNIDRFTYWTNHPFPQLQNFKNKLSIISFFCGLLVATDKFSNASLPRLAVVAVILTNIGYGEKFSGIYVAAVMYFLPGGIIKGREFFSQLLSLKKVAIFGVCLIAVFSLISYQYSSLYEQKSATQLIIDRAFGLQGHVWWGVDELNLKRASSLYSKYSVLIGESAKDEDAGMSALMYAISPVSLVQAYIANNVRFTMANPAIGLYALGSLGLLFYQIITGIFYGLFLQYFTLQIINRRLVRTLICVMIYTALFEALLMGNWFIIFSFYLIKYYFALLVIELLPKLMGYIKFQRDHNYIGRY